MDGMNVVDFGAGSGHMVREIQRSFPNCNLQCVEGEPGMVDGLRADGFQVVQKIESLRPNIDLMLMIEVIEHLDNPLETLRKIRPILSERGALFFSTPCGELRSGSRKTNAYETKEHVQFFTEQSLSRALKMAGFADVRLLTVNALYPRRGGIFQIVDRLKDLARPMRNRVFGFHHLVGVAR